MERSERCSVPGPPRSCRLSTSESAKGRRQERELQLTGRIGYEGRDIVIPTGPEGLGDIAKGVLDTMVAIQTGEIEHEWSVIANETKSA
jgi:branched-chain amino acid aminotransferase